MPLIRRYRTLGATTLLIGAAAAAWGITAIVRFLRDPLLDRRISLDEFAKGLAVPHFFALVGLGVAAFGVLLLVKSHLFLRRYRAQERVGGRPPAA